ncbi:2-oxo-4-hydroxy-4-carboxy-5-ureidoimidazoline decarboxylase [Leucobacter sp. HY1908]
MPLNDFNALPRSAAVTLVLPCVDSESWVSAVVDGRPYASLSDVVDTANAAAAHWTLSDLDAALVHHPRIGERAGGSGAEAKLSRTEQAGLATSTAIESALREGNAAYEAKFDRVFLIRAAGRSSEEILAELQRRLANDTATEVAEANAQLAEIAALRLKGILQP